MNTVQAKNQLREYRKLNELIISKQIIFTNLHLRLKNLQATNSRKEIIKQKIIRAEREYNNRKEELDRLVSLSMKNRREVEERLSKIPEPYGKILRLKYINGYSLLLISTLLNYEYTWLCKLHVRGVKMYMNVNTKDL